MNTIPETLESQILDASTLESFDNSCASLQLLSNTTSHNSLENPQAGRLVDFKSAERLAPARTAEA